jgi:hypothetical protein
MYNKIFNPYTKRYVNIKSTCGFKVLNNYINQLGGASLVQAKKVRKCGICKQPGHNCRNCPPKDENFEMDEVGPPICQVCNHPHIGKCHICGHISGVKAWSSKDGKTRKTGSNSYPNESGRDSWEMVNVDLDTVEEGKKQEDDEGDEWLLVGPTNLDNMLEINSGNLGTIYIEFTTYIGGGEFAEVYVVNIYDDNFTKILVTKSGESTVCIKVSGLKPSDLKNDARETEIAIELAQHDISPQIYDSYITNDKTIKRNLL